MLYERAGDQYVGRILSGMNVISAKFGASAPDFFYHGTVGVPEAVAIVKKKQMDLNQKVSTMLKACFGELQDLVCIRKTLCFGIASMFHHFDAANEFHTNSPLAMSPIFRKQEFIELRDSVRVVYPWENDSIAQKCVMKLTGVPPHVVQLAAIEQIKTIVSEIQPGVLVLGVEKMLDNRTIGGTLSGRD